MGRESSPELHGPSRTAGAGDNVAPAPRTPRGHANPARHPVTHASHTPKTASRRQDAPAYVQLPRPPAKDVPPRTTSSTPLTASPSNGAAASARPSPPSSPTCAPAASVPASAKRASSQILGRYWDGTRTRIAAQTSIPCQFIGCRHRWAASTAGDVTSGLGLRLLPRARNVGVQWSLQERVPKWPQAWSDPRRLHCRGSSCFATLFPAPRRLPPMLAT